MRRIVLLGLLISAAGCGGTEEPPAPVMLGLAVTATGQGSGVISSSVGGLSCTASAGVASGTCSIEVREGTSVTLTATPVAGSRLASWTGGCAGSGTALTCTLTVDEASQVGAAFELIPVVIETTTLPNARVGLAYSAALQASGGTGSFTWTLVSGALPAGLNLNALSGAIEGTPGAPGTFTFTVRVTSGSVSAERTFTLAVDAVLTLTTTVLPDAEQGQPYSAQLQATGGTPPYSWLVVAGTLPAPLQLDPATGAITGTPTAAGSAQFTVRVTAGAETAERQFTLTIAPPPIVITTTALPSGRVGQAYSSQLTATGGTGTYVWSLVTGTTPPGIQLSASGLLSGTPTTAGNSSFTARATSGTRSVDRALTLLIEPGPPVIVTTTLRGGTVGVAYADTLRATGGNGTFSWSVSTGTLPAGLSLQAATGVIAGTPEAAGTSQFTVKVLSAGQSAFGNFSITIVDAALIAEINCAGVSTGLAGNYPDCTPLFQVTLQGIPVAGATVTFVPGGGSTVARTSGVTDASGLVVAPAWRFGPAVGGQQLQARIGPATAQVQGTAAALPATDYQVVVRFTGTTPSPAQVAAFTAAAQRWSQVIIGDVPPAFASVPAAADGCYPALSESIDDVVIYARVAEIDGPGGILGQAGPRLIRNSLIPLVGCMTFDEADLQSMETDGTLNSVILHEMGHVLGIGGMWSMFGLLQGAGGPDPVFLGTSAGVAFLGARPSATPWTGVLQPVPVENIGSAGTRDSHWREATFTNELMTGFVSGPVNPLSAITAASLRDMGYVVNDAASDPYTLAAGLRAGKGVVRELHEVPPTEPIGILGPDGRIARSLQPGDMAPIRSRTGRVELMRR